MNDQWLRHVSDRLSTEGILAYRWHIRADRYDWAGDVSAILGPDVQSQPADNGEFNRLLNPQDIPERLNALHHIAEVPGGEAMQARYKMRRADGSQIEVEETGEIHRDEAGEDILYGFIRVLNAAGAVQAHANGAMDNIVGLRADTASLHGGRIHMQRLIAEWRGKQAADSKDCGFLLVIGIDRFTLYNEAFGAQFSDDIITLVGKRLREIAQTGAEVARIDGDVFAVFFKAAHHHEMPIFAKYIISNLWDHPLDTARGPLTVSVSVGGIPLQGRMNMDDPSIITSASMAMRKAKDRGRACFVSYDDASHEAQETRVTLQTAEDFMRALKDSRVRLAFQPVMDMRANRVSFHESLIRMIDDTGRMQTAAHFVPAIEKLGMGRMIDHFAMKSALHELSMFSDLHLSVNVSNQTLEDPEWLRGLVTALRDRPSVAERLIVEITESTAITNFDITMRTVRTLKELGCRVALDDFGAGYTAFSQLKSLDVDIVKIDKCFIRDMDEDQNKLFVRTLQSLAEGVEVKTVGEGAETLAEARLLAEDGIHYVQGYVYGFPQVERVWLPKDHVNRKITSGTPVRGQLPEQLHLLGRTIAGGQLN